MEYLLSMIWWLVGGGVGGYNNIHTRPLQQLPLVMSLPVFYIPHPTHATPVVQTFLKFSRWKDNLSTCLVHSHSLDTSVCFFAHLAF